MPPTMSLHTLRFADGDQPIHATVAFGHELCAQMLLDHKADLNMLGGGRFGRPRGGGGTEKTDYNFQQMLPNNESTSQMLLQN